MERHPNCTPESPDFFFPRSVDHRPNRCNGHAAFEGGLPHRIWLQHSAQKMRDVLVGDGAEGLVAGHQRHKAGRTRPKAIATNRRTVIAISVRRTAASGSLSSLIASHASTQRIHFEVARSPLGGRCRVAPRSDRANLSEGASLARDTLLRRIQGLQQSQEKLNEAKGGFPQSALQLRWFILLRACRCGRVRSVQIGDIRGQRLHGVRSRSSPGCDAIVLEERGWASLWLPPSLAAASG